MTEVGEEEHGGVAEAGGRGDSYDLAYGEIRIFSMALKGRTYYGL